MRRLPIIRLAVLAAACIAAAAASADETRAVRAAVEAHLDRHAATLLTDFRAFLSLPNVATDLPDMHANARWIEGYVTRRGFETRTVTAGGAPYVLAERRVPGAQATVLVYAHFDGQPVQPENWATPPFEPTLKDRTQVLDWDTALDGAPSREWRLYARSAGDDKAPVVALMHAIDALEAAGHPPRVNIKLFLDGEEEMGSPTVADVLAEHAGALDADVMLFCDGPMHQSGRRQLVFGVRGDTGAHLTAYGAARPLHSGHYGNWAPHPTDALMRLLVSLKDRDGRILVEGYDDEVVPVSEAERRAIEAMPPVDARLQGELALGRLEGGGERLEALILRPAIIVAGIQAGGVGDNARNIILPTATASLDLRLVPRQSVAHVRAALLRHFEKQGFHVVHDVPTEAVRRAHPDVLQVTWTSGYPAFRSPLDGPAARALTDIFTALDGTPPLLTPTMGGSLPIYLFDEALDMPIIILPIANHDNNQHGRDENLRLGNLFDAVAAYAAVLRRFDARSAR